jgi:CubicO group peptidase (beta-lactamase class C family)
MDSAGIPGLAIAMVSRGKVSSTSAIGVRQAGSSERITDTTVFEAASLSKPVVAYIVMRLIDAGSITLDQPLSKILALESHDPRAEVVTARMVLSHSTGLQNERIDSDTLAFAFQPGSSWRYSGEGYTYLGHVLESITHESLTQLADRLAFKPLGMNRSSFVWEERFAGDAATGHGLYGQLLKPGRPNVARAAATLHTTVTDYARFLSAVARGEGLSDSTKAKFTTPAIDVAKGVHWTLGWGLEDGPTGPAIAHHGDNSSAGYTAFAWLDLTTKNGVVYLTNSTEGLSVVGAVMRELSPGLHPGIEALGYETYNAPSRIARNQIYRATLAKGGETGATIYRMLKAKGPPDAFPENLLNRLGYRFLDLGKPADALALFQENVKAFPKSANVYDSLGDGLTAAGRKAEAIEAYRRSLELDPGNNHARDMIAKLSSANL